MVDRVEIRHATGDIVQDDVPFFREMEAAMIMKGLLESFEPEEAIAIALSLRGSERILQHDDAAFFYSLVQTFGTEEAWTVCFQHGIFRHLDRPLLPGFSFDLNDLSEVDCKARFRFTHDGLKRLFIGLRLPAVLTVPKYRDRISGLEGLCIVLRRLVYPQRWCDISSEFSRHVAALSRIFTYMLHLILTSVDDRIMFSKTIDHNRLLEYVRAFWRAGVPEALTIWSVIDVKKVANCRPSSNQRAQYSGHTKYHCFKYQTLETPDGKDTMLQINTCTNYLLHVYFCKVH